MIDARTQVTVDVIVELEESGAAVRVPPVDQVNVETACEQRANEGAIRLQVHDPRPVNQRETDHEGRDSCTGGLWSITVKDGLVDPMDLIARRTTYWRG